MLFQQITGLDPESHNYALVTTFMVSGVHESEAGSTGRVARIAPFSVTSHYPALVPLGANTPERP